MHTAVIGGGITGLATALGLARRGATVDLFEAGDHVGGVARAVRFAGHRFCPGPQYLWGFDDDEDATRLLAQLGVQLPSVAMPTDFEQLRIGAGAWHAAPHELDDGSAGDVRFVAALDALGRAGAAIEGDASFRLDGPAMVRAVARSADVDTLVAVLRARNLSVAELARSCGAAPATLRRLLYSQGIFAERLQDLSAVVYAAARRHLRRTLRVPVGGVVALVDALSAAVVAAGVRVHLGERVLELDSTTLRTDRRVVAVDDVVFCTSPAALPASLRTHARAAFVPSHTIGATCAAVDLDDEQRLLLHRRNFNFFAHNDDVAFDTAGDATATLNFTCTTLHAVEVHEAPTRQVVCAFFPLGADDDVDDVFARAEQTLSAQLGAVLGRPLEAVQHLRIAPTTWTEHFGASNGAVYGRRLTSSSLRRSQVDNLPAHVHLAHSGAGIPGVLGCLQLAAVVVGEVGR